MIEARISRKMIFISRKISFFSDKSEYCQDVSLLLLLMKQLQNYLTFEYIVNKKHNDWTKPTSLGLLDWHHTKSNCSKLSFCVLWFVKCLNFAARLPEHLLSF